MQIRKDFEPVEVFMHRLLKIGQAFSENNNQHWSHLKNQEDFDKVYSFPDEILSAIEAIYCYGRNCAVSMASKLKSFNYADEYPTLSNYVDSFESGWVYQIDDLKIILDKAKVSSKLLNRTPWAVEQMFILFNGQLELLDAVKSTINIIKQSHLYRLEKGEVPMERENKINIGTIHGKVNIHSTDNSINISSASETVFTSLKSAILASDIPVHEKEKLAVSVDDMQQSHGKEEFIQKYKGFMQDAANHMTVFSPFIPALTGLLS